MPKGFPKNVPPGEIQHRSKRHPGCDGQALIPGMVQAALGATTLTRVTQPLDADSRRNLSRAIGMDVDEWRREFGVSLRRTAAKLLEITERDLEKIRPDNRGYTLAVLFDKASALESRGQQLPSTLVQNVNHFYAPGSGPSRADMIASLDGRRTETPAQPEPPQIALERPEQGAEEAEAIAFKPTAEPSRTRATPENASETPVIANASEGSITQDAQQ